MGIFSIFTIDAPFYIVLIVLCAYLLALFISIVSHEYAHAFTAFKMGDPTAKLAGRMSFNPVKHFDPVGMLLLLFFGFGWAKGVPINPTLFRNYKKGQVLVSIAGILTNLVFAVVFTFLSVVADLFFHSEVLILLFLQYLFAYIAIISFVLAIFNLIPIFPLDGFSLISTFLPYNSKFVVFMRQYGIIILICLMLILSLFPAAFNGVISFFYDGLYGLFARIFV